MSRVDFVTFIIYWNFQFVQDNRKVLTIYKFALHI